MRTPQQIQDLKKAGALTQPRMLSLCALFDYHTFALAAQRLKISDDKVRQHIRDLEGVFGTGSLFEKSRDGRPIKFTPLGRSVAAECRQILETQVAVVGRPTVTSVRYLPHHSIWVLKAVQLLEDDGLPVELHVLGEHHRARDHFMDLALRPIVAGLLDVAVGLDFRSETDATSKTVTDKLTAVPLYSAWLEALVPLNGQWAEKDHVTIEELYSHGKILTSPAQTRSRTYLERAVGAHGGEDPLHVRLAEYESKVLVIGTYAKLGITVLPSDVALQFDKNGPLAGPPSKHHTWLPVHDILGERIQYDVVAYRRADGTKNIAGAVAVINKLKEQVREVMTDAGREEALHIQARPVSVITTPITGD